MVRQSFQEAEFSLTEPLMKRQNKQLWSHSPVSKRTTWQGVLVGQSQTLPPAEQNTCYLKKFGYLKTEVSYPPYLWPAATQASCPRLFLPSGFGWTWDLEYQQDTGLCQTLHVPCLVMVWGARGSSSTSRNHEDLLWETKHGYFLLS